MANQLWRANQHEPACFRLSSPWYFPSRSGTLLHAVDQRWLSLQRSISSWNVPPLVLPSCAIPSCPGVQSSTGRRWCRKLWICRGNITSTLFTGPSRSPRPPPILRTYAFRQSHPPCAPQIPRTRSLSCVTSPWCSHFPSPWACPDSKSGGRFDCF